MFDIQMLFYYEQTESAYFLLLQRKGRFPDSEHCEWLAS